MAEDKKTIGLTDANKTIMDRVVEKAGFKREVLVQTVERPGILR
jgi:hypothetical protein